MERNKKIVIVASGILLISLVTILKRGKKTNSNYFLKYIFMDPVVLFYFLDFVLNALMSYFRLRYRQE